MNPLKNPLEKKSEKFYIQMVKFMLYIFFTIIKTNITVATSGYYVFYYLFVFFPFSVVDMYLLAWKTKWINETIMKSLVTQFNNMKTIKN